MKVDIDDVWAGHPVKFALERVGFQIYLSYYDKNRKLIVAIYNILNRKLSKHTLPETLGWDSHNGISIGIDFFGYIHVSANMHNSQLIYYRSKKPYSLQGFDRILKMVGTRESFCTYPMFIKNNNKLFFTYRTGGSGNGKTIINHYNPKTSTWRRVSNTPLFDGEGRMSAYPSEISFGPDNFFHLTWVWRNSPDCETNHTLSYVKTKNFREWYTASEEKIILPIKNGGGDIIEEISINGGIINNNIEIGFDSKRRQVVTYHRFDETGNTQIYNARFERDKWRVYKMTNWMYRWNFTGKGAIENEIEIFPVKIFGVFSNKMIQRWKHREYGEGDWILDNNLQIKKSKSLNKKDRKLMTPEKKDCIVRVCRDIESGVFIKWETFPKNRDKEFQVSDKTMLNSRLVLNVSLKLQIKLHIQDRLLSIKDKGKYFFRKIRNF